MTSVKNYIKIIVQCKTYNGGNMPYNITEDKIEEIKNLNDIVDVINELVPLKRAGANYNARCPFHKEQTPSFVVSPDKQIYHCFGCGENGDVINFIMKYKNYTFVETIEYLAKRAGIILEEKKTNNINNEKNKRLYEINRQAAIFYFNNLKNNDKALKYLEKRKIENKVIKKFGLGYAIKEWDKLLVYLKKKGYKEEEILQTGLIINNKKKNSYYDRFRNRVIFPIVDTKKRIIGFGGRVLDNTLPKYINSPDSFIFNKGRNLYGLNIAKNHIKNKRFILAEGYMDVIKLHNYGYDTAVASLGTALTDNQVKLMRRYTKKFYVAYDSDQAGLKASLKALNILKKNNLDANVVIMPDGCDPDEFLTNYGKIKFDELIKKSLDYFEFLDFYYSKLFDKDDKIQYINKFFDSINNINSIIERELVLEKLAMKVNVSKETVINEYNRIHKKYVKNKTNKVVKNLNSKPTNKIMRTYEDKIIEIILANADMVLLLKDFIDNKIFVKDEYNLIFKKLYDYKIENKEISVYNINELNNLKLNLEKVEEYKNLPNEDIMLLFKECKKKIKMKYYEEKRREYKEHLKKSSKEIEAKELMQKIIDLDKEMKKLKEEVY